MTTTMYAMRYHGATGAGVGALCFGNGKVIGLDAGGGHYNGSYTENAGRFQVKVAITAPNGARLVTGQPIGAGDSIPVAADVANDLGGGQPVQITVAGRPVTVMFEKIGEI